MHSASTAYLPHGRLTFIEHSCSLDVLSLTHIRVVGALRKKRLVDPVISEVEASLWRLWMWESRPLSRLAWDPGECLWPSAELGSPPVSFFESSARIGLYFLVRYEHAQPTQLRRWLYAGHSHAFLAQFWTAPWQAHVSWWIAFFLWMIAHVGLAVGTWAARVGHDPTCT
eukprot:c9849_g1_i1 orf=261-770(-)